MSFFFFQPFVSFVLTLTSYKKKFVSNTQVYFFYQPFVLTFTPSFNNKIANVSFSTLFYFVPTSKGVFPTDTMIRIVFAYIWCQCHFSFKTKLEYWTGLGTTIITQQLCNNNFFMISWIFCLLLSNKIYPESRNELLIFFIKQSSGKTPQCHWLFCSIYCHLVSDNKELEMVCVSATQPKLTFSIWLNLPSSRTDILSFVFCFKDSRNPLPQSFYLQSQFSLQVQISNEATWRWCEPTCLSHEP